MFDPIQYIITMEGNTEYSVNKRRSILDNIEDKYLRIIESEINSFKKLPIILSRLWKMS